MKSILSIAIIFLSLTNISAQYATYLDIRGSNDNMNGAEFQLATPSETNFLRFFRGRVGDPNPYLYFSNADTFRIASGGAGFSKFKELLR